MRKYRDRYGGDIGLYPSLEIVDERSACRGVPFGRKAQI